MTELLSKNRIRVPGFFFIPLVLPYDIIHRVFVSLNEQYNVPSHYDYEERRKKTKNNPSTHSNRCTGCAVMSAFY